MNEDLLTQRIDEVLHYIWDPLGVKNVPEARDEYSSYVGTVVRMVVDGRSVQDIADYLISVEIEAMGLDPVRDPSGRHIEISKLLLDWAAFSKK
jgi:hypothetical protein